MASQIGPAEQTPYSLGAVTIATAGTPLQLATTPTLCSRIRVSLTVGMTSRIYFGTSAVNHSSLVGVIYELTPFNGAGVVASDPYIEISTVDGKNGFDLSNYWLDSNTNSGQAVVAYWVGPAD
jgi:hypothetical protein